MEPLQLEYYRSLSFFKLVCKKIGIKNPKLRGKLVDQLKNTKSGQLRNNLSNDPYVFTDEDLFQVFYSNSTAQKFCINNSITNWEEVVQIVGK